MIKVPVIVDEIAKWRLNYTYLEITDRTNWLQQWHTGKGIIFWMNACSIEVLGQWKRVISLE